MTFYDIFYTSKLINIFFTYVHIHCAFAVYDIKKPLKRYQIEKFIFEEIKSFTDQIYFMIRITYYD